MDESSIHSPAIAAQHRLIADNLSNIDAVLICDSSLTSIGALPLVLSKLNSKGVTPPMVYGTFPTAKMGQMSLYDFHARCSTDGVSLGWGLDNIDAVFATDRFCAMKYSQTIVLQVDGRNAVSITPHRSGRYVGAAFWVLRRIQDEAEVVVAPHYNHAKERHLDASQLPKYAAAADVLVTRPGGPCGMLGKLYSSFGKEKPVLRAQPWTRREGEFIDTVMSTLRRGGNVLVPVDASGRVLELLLLLSAHWRRQRLDAAYVLCWVGPMTWNVSNFARSQLEWMAEPLGRQFDSQLGHPYSLKNVNICTNIAELDIISKSTKGLPMTVLASGGTFDSGPARDLLLKWGDNPDNAIVFPDSQHCVHRSIDPGAISANDHSTLTAAAQMLSKWCEAKAAGEEMADSISIDVLIPRKEPLTGEELDKFLQEEDAAVKEKQAMEEEKKLLEEVEMAKGRLRLGDDTEGTDYIASNKSNATSNAAPRLNPKPAKKSRFDSNLFLKFSKPNFMCFESREEAAGISYPDRIGKGVFSSAGKEGQLNIVEDDYGIGIRRNHFIDIVSGIDPSKTGGRLMDDSLRRGFGFGVDGKPVIGSNIPNKTQNTPDRGKLDEAIPEEDEQILEASDLAEGRGIIRGRNGNPPIKVFTSHESLEVLAEIVYIPLDGRVNARSARQTVRALQPGQVVIFGGGASPETRTGGDGGDTLSAQSEASMLADMVREMSNQSHRRQHKQAKDDVVHIPSDGEQMELCIGHAAYPARLIDAPYLSKADRVKEMDSAPIAVELNEETLGDYTVSIVDYVATGQRVAVDNSIVLAPRVVSDNSSITGSSANVMLSDGDVLLTDLRSEVIAQGMKAVYSTHIGFQQLVVNSRIVVKRDQDTGKIQVEGPLCEDFFNVRKIVCGHYVTL